MRISSIRLAAGAAAALSALSTAQATWSIILIDTRTGEVAAASATCLTGFDLRANTPVLIPGVGAATAQSFVDTTGQNRIFIRDRLALGVAPQDILTQLATFDSGHQTRQYGIGDVYGRMATFSGTGAGAWAGGQTGSFASGQIGTIAYAIQGNVLTGPPVVEQAVQAAIATPGDLPAKLMASMQAARLMGGDGRCSCNPNNPTSCGSPPPSFLKSAHIAYMLIARAGDTEGANGIYRAGSSPQAMIAADINGDQRPDLVTANFGSASTTLNISNSVAPALAPIFSPLPTSFPTSAGANALALADLNGDLIRDLITVGNTSSIVNIFRGSPDGAFSPIATASVGGSPKAIVAAHFDSFYGPDLATANLSTNNVSILLDHGAGGFIAAPAPAVGSGPVDLVALNIVGSPATDLVVLCRGAHTLTFLRGNGNGTFEPDQIIPTNTGGSALIAADLDGDTDIDFAISCDGPGAVQVFRNDGAGLFTPTTYPLPFLAAGLAVGDVNGDSHPDIIACGSGSFATLFNQGPGGGGTFVIDRVYTIAAGVASPSLADLDNDGDLDAAFVSSNLGSVVTVKNLGPGPQFGKFNDGLGCATGDYFMNFNVAFQAASDPDPVATLQVRYDQWRAALVGRPDAVQSIVSVDPPYLPSVGAAPARTSTLTFALRDWHNDPVTTAMTSIAVTHAPGSSSLTAIGPVQPQGNGIYRVTLTGGKTPGIDRLRITVDDGTRPVTLMPDAVISIYAGPCYANCDASTGSPALTANDFACFLERFIARDPYANCDSAPAFTAGDFQCFINRFAAGCP